MPGLADLDLEKDGKEDMMTRMTIRAMAKHNGSGVNYGSGR